MILLIWYSTLASFILLKMNYNEDRIENLKKKDFDILIILSFFFQEIYVPVQRITQRPSCPECKGKALEPEVSQYDLPKVQLSKRPSKPRYNKR